MRANLSSILIGKPDRAGFYEYARHTARTAPNPELLKKARQLARAGVIDIVQRKEGYDLVYTARPRRA